jgi:hypothetical protein
MTPSRPARIESAMAGAATALPRRTLLAAAFARLTRPVVARTAAFGGMLAVYGFVTGPQLKNVVFYDGDVWHKVIMTLVGSLIDAFTLLVFLLIADEAIARGAGRFRTYASAAIAAALVAAWINWYWFLWIFFLGMPPDDDPWLASVLPLEVVHSLVLAAGATFVYADLRRGRESVARLQYAEIARASHVRDALGARLSAMQARVEPQFLFDTLAQVRRTFRHDRASASRMLDDLIAYLRAAMPQLRVSASTVGREVELAGAYVRVMTLRRGAVGSLGASIADDVREVPFLPMIVLPLVQAAIARSEGRDPAIVIRASVAMGLLRIHVGAGNDAFAPNAPPDVVDGLRERLVAHYGANARLELVRIDASTAQAVIEVPDERTDRRHR